MKRNVGCTALFCLLATAARGQTPAVIECETNAACAELYEQAQQQSKAGQLVEAESGYKKAYEVSHDVRLLFNIARVLDKRGQESEALTYYRLFMDAPINNEAQKAKARAYVEQLEARLAAQSTVGDEQNGKPVYRKVWFWGVVLGSVAAIGLGVGLGLGLRQPSATQSSDPNVYEPSF